MDVNRGKGNSDRDFLEELRREYLEEETIDAEKLGWKYLLWWKLQEYSILLFLVTLVLSVIWEWWFLFPAFILLSINLFANFSRLRELDEALKRRRSGTSPE